MAIQSILNTQNTAAIMKQESHHPTPYEAQTNFSTYLKDAIQEVNNKQIESDVMTNKLIMGENVDLHNVMITAQKATIALNATMEIRNKVVEAYQEIIRMPV